MPNFMETRPLGAELFHANGGMDGQTDRTKQIFSFHTLVNGA